MHTTRTVLVRGGVTMLLAAVALGAWGAVSDESVIGSTLVVSAAVLGFVGGLFALVGWFLARLDPTATLVTGIDGTALVRGVRDTGLTIANYQAVFAADVTVEVPGREPYEATMRLALPRFRWGELRPGMVVPVKVDRDHPARVAYAPTGYGSTGSSTGPADASTIGPTTLAGTAGAPGLGGRTGAHQPGDVIVAAPSAGEIIARGVPTLGTLEACEPTGFTAGAVISRLRADEADDPVLKLVVAFTPATPAPGDIGTVRVELLARLPADQRDALRPGAVVPIRYLPEAPGTATIDWDRA